MDINDVITVRLQITDSQGNKLDSPVIASGILAAEDYPEATWDRFLQWRFLDLADIIPPGVRQTRQVALDLEERATGRCRRVVLQMLAGSRITLSWDDVKGNPGAFEVILDLTGPGGAAHVARIAADAGDVTLASHVRIRGDSLEDLLEG